MNSPVIISLNDISKVYHLFKTQIYRVLNSFGMERFSQNPNRGYVGEKKSLISVSMDIRAGEKVGVIGSNGSGKTTLLKLIIKQIEPTSGSLIVNGKVQALMQTGYAFNEDVSGFDNIKNALIYNGLKNSQREEKLNDIVEFVELGEFINHPIKTYSLGMRARLEFATATAIFPDILAIDEVLGAGDGYFVNKCAQRMHNIVNDTTLLLVSHSMQQILTYCDRVIWLNQGELVADGAAETVIKSYEEFMIQQNSILQDSHEHSVVTDCKTESVSEFNQKNVEEKSIEVLTNDKRTLIDSELPSIVGVKFGASGSNTYAMETGDDLAITIDIVVPNAFKGKIKPVLYGFSEDGLLIWDAIGDTVTLKPDSSKHVSLKLNRDKFFAGVGSYFISAGIASDDLEDLIDSPNLYDISHATLYLRMLETNYSDPPIFHCPADWKYGKDTTDSDSARISAWV